MPLYRTISDRGIWKKNSRHEDPKPQHFHKPAYIDKEKPVVTYSQLNLGEGYRYNSRQSIPDVNKDVDAANARFDEAYSEGYRSRQSRSFKSCPTTPRATTPTRTLSRASRNPAGADPNSSFYLEHAAPPTHYSYALNTPYLANGQYVPTPQFRDYPEDDRCSFESRSLTAYSNYSERDSTVDSSYRYPYAREPVLLPDQINPFQPGLATRQAEDVVQMFLQKSFFPNAVNNNGTDKGIGRIEDYSSTISPTSPLSPPQESEASSPPRSSSRAAIAELKRSFLEKPAPPPPSLQKPKPNKYLSSGARRTPPATPTRASTTVVTTVLQGPEASPPILLSPSRPAPPPPPRKDDQPLSAALAQALKERALAAEAAVVSEKHLVNGGVPEGSGQPEVCSREDVCQPSAEKVALEQLLRQAPVWQPKEKDREDGFEATPAKEQPAVSLDQPSAEQQTLALLLQQTPVWQPGQQSSRPTSRMEVAQPHFMSDTVRAEQIPALHHAETVSVRVAESTDSSVSSSEDERDNSSGNIMVSIKPVSEPQAAPVLLSPRLEAPPAKHSPWGPNPRRVSQEAAHPDTHLLDTDQHQFPAASSFQPQPVPVFQPPRQQPPPPPTTDEEETEEMLPDRSFQDPAFATFHEEKERQKQKKKGFFSFFKKSGKKKQPYGDDFIHIERRLDLGDDDGDSDSAVAELEGDQSPRFHILQPDSQPAVPMPGSQAHRRLFPAGEHSRHEEQHYVEQTQEVQEQYSEQEAGHYPEQYLEAHSEHQLPQPPEPLNTTQSSEEYAAEEEPVAPLPSSLQRRPSAGKPTDMDDLILKHNTKMNSYSGLTHLDIELEPPRGKETNVDDLWEDREQVRAVQQAYIPPHEMTQEIDIDAMLDYSDSQAGSDEEQEQSEQQNREEKEQNRLEEEQLQRQEEQLHRQEEQKRWKEEEARLQEERLLQEQKLKEQQHQEQHKQEQWQQEQWQQEQWQQEQQQQEQHKQEQWQQEQWQQEQQQQEQWQQEQQQEQRQLEQQLLLEEEQRRLEDERNYLAMQNLVLEQQLQEQEREQEEEREGHRAASRENSEGSRTSDGAVSVIVKEGADLNYSLLAKQEAEWRAVAITDGRVRPSSAAEERKAGESFFNFKSFRKPKTKNRPKSFDDPALSSGSDDRREDKRKKGLGSVFNVQKAKNRHSSFHPKKDGDHKEDKDTNEIEFKEDENYESPNESNEETMKEQDVVDECLENIQDDDLAAKIVREIQKSTTELNIRSKSLPKLSKGSEKSAFGAAAMRFSIKKSKKKDKKKEDETIHDVDQINGEHIAVDVMVNDVTQLNGVCEDEVEMEANDIEPDTIETENTIEANGLLEASSPEMEEQRLRSQSMTSKREKKAGAPGLGDMFRMRTGSRGRPRQREEEEEGQEEQRRGWKGSGLFGSGKRSKSKTRLPQQAQRREEEQDLEQQGQSLPYEEQEQSLPYGAPEQEESLPYEQEEPVSAQEQENTSQQQEQDEVPRKGRKSPGVFGSSGLFGSNKRSKSRTRGPPPQKMQDTEPQELQQQGESFPHEEIGVKQEHPSPDSQEVQEAPRKSGKSPGGLGSLFSSLSKQRAPPLPSSRPPLPAPAASPPPAQAASFSRSSSQKSVRRPGLRQPPALRPLDSPPPPPQELQTAPLTEEPPLSQQHEQGSRHQAQQPNILNLEPPRRTPSPCLQSPSPQIQQPNPYVQTSAPSARLDSPSPLIAEPLQDASPLREDPSPQGRQEEAPSPGLDTSFQSSGGGDRPRMKGRQSGRFRKSATTPSLASAAPPPGSSAQAHYLASVVAPVQPSASLSRTESYRRARGEPPRRGEQYSSLPRRGRPGGKGVARANSEDSVREAIAREGEQRKGKGKEKGDCTVM